MTQLKPQNLCKAIFTAFTGVLGFDWCSKKLPGWVFEIEFVRITWTIMTTSHH